ncbi:MAG: hypothetical protein LBH37_04745 [Oscillospiraceae bacterium]|jgi:hypothetical protein|nr:hypothetical protein [Oscillospiraceae bacterium]
MFTLAAPEFLLIPPIWLVLLPVTFVLDSVVLFISLKMVNSPDVMGSYKKVILAIWKNSFIADLLGALVGFAVNCVFSWLSSSQNGQELALYSRNEQVMPYMVLIAALVASLLVYILDRRVLRASLDLEESFNRKRIALMLALFTSPLVMLGCYFIGSFSFGSPVVINYS